ncbi:MAG: MazG-like family protein [Acetivibrionales bacterium]
MWLLDKDIDITRNIKIIEWLKSELLTDIANLFKILVNGMKEEVHDSISETLSNIILISYLLGRRLGISYNAIEIKVEKKIKLGLIENHDVEKFYGDLSELSKHLDSSREKKAKNCR